MKIEQRGPEGAGGFLAELGLEVISEFLPDSLVGLLFSAAIAVLMVLIWVGRRVFENS
jgi:hypothetical protein